MKQDRRFCDDFLRRYREQAAAEELERRPPEALTLCWRCRWATNPPPHPCPWAAKLRPVAGWEAEAVRCSGELTYRVSACPIYEEG